MFCPAFFLCRYGLCNAALDLVCVDMMVMSYA